MVFCLAAFSVALFAQDAPVDLLDRDFDSLFDDLFSEEYFDDDESDEVKAPVRPVNVRSQGFSIDFSYNAYAGYAPGLNEGPWYWNNDEYPVEYAHKLGVQLSAHVGLDVQVSENLRARTTIDYVVPPGNGFSMGDFFLDYSVANMFFFRLGKFTQNWGISRNFNSANLLSRIPDGKGGDPYTVKVDIPIGVGGVQLLALTRPGFMAGSTPSFSEIGYGGKYNLAFVWADSDMGVFYHKEMPLRGFAAVKTTIGDTELYLEGMGAVNHESWDGFTISGNFGVAQNFFDDALTLNGEVFWNGEENAFWFSAATDLEAARSSPFIPNLNAALNVLFKPEWFWGFRFFVKGLWAWENNTTQIIPGFDFKPLPNLTVSLGFPFALGSRDGTYYYNHDANTDDWPASIVLLITLSGSYGFGRYQ
jgi:hypothetical protein